MTKKIFYGIFTVAFLTVISAICITFFVQFNAYQSQIKRELKNEANFIQVGMNISGEAYLDGLAISDNRVTWIDSDGTVLFDSYVDSEKLDNHYNREEVQNAISNGDSVVTRFSNTLSERSIYYARLLDDNTIIRVSSKQGSIWGLVMDTFLVVIIIMSTLLVICMMLAAKIAKIIVKPINDVDLENPDVDEHYVELSPLLHKINKQNKQIKKNMSDLKRKQKEFNLITQNMEEGLLIIDGKGEVLSYNNAILKLCNIKQIKDNVIAYTLNRNKNFTNVIDAAISGDKIEETIHSNGRVYCAITNPISKKKRSIEKSGAVIIFLDVTEKEHRDQLRREFTSNVSHELKTPLTTIYGVADMLSSGLIKSEDVSRFGKDIYNEAERMITLINDIIKLSSLDEGAVEEDLKKSVDMMSVCNRVVSRLSSKASSHGINLNIAGDTACVFGVESMLEEIFYNLTDNAIKYNKENGSVDINIKRISIKDEELVEITVKDNGIGIPADQSDRVFERFFRVDKSHSRKIGGTGLGLSIVKHAVAYHGGDIKVESEENVGTTMVVILPVM